MTYSFFNQQTQAVRHNIKWLLEQELAESPEITRFVSRALGFHAQYGIEKGGKWGLFTLAACQAAGGKWEEAVPAAVAMEFFRAAGDLFDDIEDCDLIVEDALPQATNAATVLLFLTIKAASQLEKREKALLTITAIGEAGIRSCRGQSYDLAYETIPSISEETWLHMTDLRSGSLVGCASKVGAIVATDNGQTIESYAQFGRNLGIAGQILNDLHSLSSSSGKSDIARRKKTFPLVHALNNAEDRERKVLQEFCSGDEPVPPEMEEDIRQIILRSGSLYYSAFVAEEYRLGAFHFLREAGVSTQVISELEAAMQWLQ